MPVSWCQWLSGEGTMPTDKQVRRSKIFNQGPTDHLTSIDLYERMKEPEEILASIEIAVTFVFLVFLPLFCVLWKNVDEY